MSLASNMLLKNIQGSSPTDDKNTRLAKVYSATSTGARLIFAGETEPSQMSYKMLNTVGTLTAGQTVILTRVNNSYIITGRIV